MELYLAGVGTKPHSDSWLNDLRAVKLPYRDERGEPKHYVRMGVAEFKLVKLFFPEEYLDEVMALCGVGTEQGHVLNRHPALKKFLGVARRALGLKKIKYPKEIVKHMEPTYMAVVPLGTKKDSYNENGIELI